MKMEKENICVLTHTDLDGVMCGLLFQAAYGENNIVVQNLNYNEINSAAVEASSATAETIFVTDILCNEESLSKLLESGKNVVVIDHHKTSSWVLDIQHSGLKVVLDTTKSATLLVWEWLKSQGFNLNSWEKLVMAVNSHDLWLRDNPQSEKINSLLYLLGQARFSRRFLENQSLELSPAEELVLQLERERADRVISSALERVQYFTDSQGKRYGFLYAEGYPSEIGAAIANQTGVDYAVIIMMHITPVPGEKPGVVSLRSADKADVSEIARCHGGGGHKNAAGFFVKNWSADYFGMAL